MPAKYYNSPIGVYIEDNGEWELCDNGTSYKGTNMGDLIERMKNLSPLKKRIFVGDLGFFYALTRNDYNFKEVKQDKSEKSKVKYIMVDDNCQLCNAQDFAAVSLRDWRKELDLEEGVSYAKVIYIGVKKELDNTSRGIYYMPTTRTGYVRRAISALNINFTPLQLDDEQYKLYRKLPRAGLCSLAEGWENEKVNIWAYDIKSSYPFEMVSKIYPRRASKVIKNISLEEFLVKKDSMWVATINFKKIKPKLYDYYGYEDKKQLTVTSVDFKAIEEFYNYKIESVEEIMYHIFKAKLWDKLRNLILQFFDDKEKQDKKSEKYQIAKKALNSIFGLFAQDFLEWNEKLDK